MNDGIFTYYNVFANAGSEYIWIILFWIALIGFWYFLNMRAER
jgi:hypothetical protein